MLIANLVPSGGLEAVFSVLGAVCIVSFFVSRFMIETRERKLEEIAP
jgi:hypothetical protein